MTQEPTPHGPLSGLRVLEMADEKGQFCGKLMGDLGADVIKVEPPGGERTRSVGPFLDDIPHPDRSLYFWHYNTSKRGITLDLNTGDGRELFKGLVATADVVLETRPPGYLPSLGLGYEDLSAINPRLIMCSLTPFGQTGPWRDYLASDLMHMAGGGQMASCGYDDDDVPDAPPIAPGGGNVGHIGGAYAQVALLAAICQRDISGEGQYIDISIHEACTHSSEIAVPIYVYEGQVVLRHTGRTALPDISPKTQLSCKDGKWININRIASRMEPPRLRLLAEWMDKHGLAQDLLDEKYQDPQTIQDEINHINDAVENFFANITQEEAYHSGQAVGFPWGAIQTIEDVELDPGLIERGFFLDVEHPELDTSFTYTGPAAIYSTLSWGISRRAPRVGEHNEQVLCAEMGLSKDDLMMLVSAGAI